MVAIQVVDQWCVPVQLGGKDNAFKVISLQAAQRGQEVDAWREKERDSERGREGERQRQTETKRQADDKESQSLCEPPSLRLLTARMYLHR